MLEDYQNKVCVVTGAASGIGKALCEKLVALGAQVYALDRNKADIEGLSAFVETDLSDKGSIDAAFGVLPQVIDRFFGVAGLSGARTSYWLTFTVNFIANKYMTDTYLEKRIPSGGSIAYVTSCGGLMWEKWRKEYVKVMDCKTWDEMVAFMKSVSPKDGVGVMAYTLSKRAIIFRIPRHPRQLGNADFFCVQFQIIHALLILGITDGLWRILCTRCTKSSYIVWLVWATSGSVLQSITCWM